MNFESLDSHDLAAFVYTPHLQAAVQLQNPLNAKNIQCDYQSLCIFASLKSVSKCLLKNHIVSEQDVDPD